MPRRSATPTQPATGGGSRRSPLRGALAKFQGRYKNARPPGGITQPVGTYPCILKTVTVREAKDKQGKDQIVISVDYEITEDDYAGETIRDSFWSTEYGEGDSKNAVGLGRFKLVADMFNQGEPIESLDEAVEFLQEAAAEGNVECSVKITESPRKDGGRPFKNAELDEVYFERGDEPRSPDGEEPED